MGRAAAGRDPALDCARGIAIALVVAHHAAAVAGPRPGSGEAVPLLRGFIDAGHTGVTLFFVLSGFLISRPFIARALGGPPVHLSTYFARRALRILPLYVPAVLIAAALAADGPSDLRRAVPHLFFLTPFGRAAAPLWPHSAVWWSLAPEVQFYLALPLVAWLSARLGGLRFVLVLVMAAAVAYVALLGVWLPMSIPTAIGLKLSLPGRGFAFAAGAGLAWLDVRRGEKLRGVLGSVGVLRAGGTDVVFAGLLVGFAALLATVASDGFWVWEADWRHAWHLIESLVWTSLIALLLYAPLRLRAAVVNRPLVALGRASFPLYLVHLPILVALLPWLAVKIGVGAGTAIAVAVCLAIAAIVHALVERPILAYSARIGAKSKAPPASPAYGATRAR